MRAWTHTRTFWCDTCHPAGTRTNAEAAGMTGEQFRKHLVEAHGLLGQITGKKALRLAIDGSDHRSITVDWTFPGGVRATEVSASNRVREGRGR